MAETRGITVKIPADLHAQVKAEQEMLGNTMSQYIENVLTEHFTMERKEDKDMGPTRTLAVQVSEDLFQRVKDYLDKTKITQKKFVIGLIEAELERFEMSEKAQAVDTSAADEEKDGQNAAESPREGGWEATEGSDEASGEDAAEDRQDDGEATGEDEGETNDEDDDEIDDDEDENMGMGPVM